MTLFSHMPIPVCNSVDRDIILEHWISMLTSEPLIGWNASLQDYNLATQAILIFNLLREAEEYSMISGYKIVSLNLT